MIVNERYLGTQRIEKYLYKVAVPWALVLIFIGTPSTPNLTTANTSAGITTGATTGTNTGATTNNKTRIDTRIDTRINTPTTIGIPEKGSGQDRFRQLLPSFNPRGIHRRRKSIHLLNLG